MTERSPDRPSAKSSARTSARDLVARTTSLDGVMAEPAELEIRSGIGIIIRDPMKRGVPAETQAEIQASLDNGIIIDRFIAEWGFDVSHEKAKDFHAWLVVNEKQIKLYCPAGVHYRGTYAVAAGDRQKTGRYRTIWGFASFSDMQLLAEQLGDETSALRRVIDEFNLYRDRSSHAAEVEWIMVPAAGALRL